MGVDGNVAIHPETTETSSRCFSGFEACRHFDRCGSRAACHCGRVTTYAIDHSGTERGSIVAVFNAHVSKVSLTGDYGCVDKDAGGTDCEVFLVPAGEHVAVGDHGTFARVRFENCCDGLVLINRVSAVAH